MESEEFGGEVTITDRDGKTLRFCRCRGRLYPPSPDMGKRLSELQSHVARPDDIYICAYMKSGTHWVHEIVELLVRDAKELSPQAKEEYMMEFVAVSELDKLPSPRIINHHLHPDMSPRSIMDSGAKIISILRNPRDIAVSMYHHVIGVVGRAQSKVQDYTGSWEAFLELFMRASIGQGGHWAEYEKEWWQVTVAAEPTYTNSLWITYEELSRNPVAVIEQIAQFIDRPKSANRYKEIAELCGFDRMRKEKSQVVRGIPKEEFWRQGYDMYRKGKVGNWKEWFSESQLKTFDAYIAQSLHGMDKRLIDMIEYEL